MKVSGGKYCTSHTMMDQDLIEEEGFDGSTLFTSFFRFLNDLALTWALGLGECLMNGEFMRMGRKTKLGAVELAK
jgi:hypothetical protein